VLRPLSRLPEEQQAAAYQDAVEAAGGPPTAKQVKAVVDTYAADNEPYEAPQEEEEAEDEAEDEAEELLDAEGNGVPESLYAIFAPDSEWQQKITALKDACRAVRDLKRWFVRHEKFPKRLPGEAINDDARLWDEARLVLTPHIVHTPCGGEGCKGCQNQGWLSKAEATTHYKRRPTDAQIEFLHKLDPDAPVRASMMLVGLDIDRLKRKGKKGEVLGFGEVDSSELQKLVEGNE